MSNERLIKKYPNRRLYDTEESRYITLAEVKELVMRSVPFKVVDSQNEQDITRGILLQIIMEQEAGGSPMFTATMLERFIRFYGDTAQAAFTNFLDQNLDLFLKQQRMFSEHMQGIWSGNPMDFWLKLGQQNMSFWKDMEETTRRNADVEGNGKSKS
ncbi:MAG: polyhydroxyalkanoate synthesis repressor PhaR [Betaproteobacteria bacterium]|nr:polyhydroxyalkanoate synthesis repressor PhaR [Betaproteobacteria bacterium]